jgi:coenzyme F420 hydrogenase subunit beta
MTHFLPLTLTRRPKTLGDIVAGGLCLGCGLCESLGRAEGIRMELNDRGYLRPTATAKPSTALQRRILAICPGLRQRPHWLQARKPQSGDAIWGPYERLSMGHATDNTIRFRGSSAGVLTAIAIHLLESGAVSSVLHVRADPAAPMRNQAQISRSRADVMAGVGSRYAPTAPLTVIMQLLDEGAPFAVVGRPCDIAGIRNLARSDARVNRLLRLTLSFFCAGVSTQSISARLVAERGLAESDVQLLRYRGHGCPGPLRIEAKDGRSWEQSYDETWSSPLNQEVQFRCKICPDSTGEQADIVCGDAWGSGDGYAHGDRDGVSVVIARSAAGLRILDTLAAEGQIALAPLDRATLHRMQPQHVRRKQAVLARILGIALAGAMIPDFRGLRLLRASLLDRGGIRRNLRGAMRRIASGNHREETAL